MKVLRRVGIVVLLALVAAALGWSQPGTESKERVTLHMFMGNSGVPHPEGLDPSNNWAINVIENYANVDLVLEVPAYLDFTTKLNLLLASGNLPDIIHGWLTNEMNKAADDGAFIDIKKYYDKSPVVQKVVTAQAMDMAKSPGGKYWGLPIMTTGTLQGSGQVVRLDLWEKFNGGKNPGTVEGWIEYLKWIKNNVPNSIPFTSARSGEYIWTASETFFTWHGVSPTGSSIRGGKVVRDFTLPAYRAAVEVHRKLYTDGLLDKEFLTNTVQDRVTKCYGKDVGLWSYPLDQIMLNMAVFNKNLGGGDKFWTLAPELTQYPAAVTDKKYTYGTLGSIIGGHRTGITSACKMPDRAWKVLEAFCSDELKEVMSWGRAGIDYTVKDGKKVPNVDKIFIRNDKDPESMYWTLHLGIVLGFSAMNDTRRAIVEQQVGSAVYNKIRDNSMWVENAAKQVGIHFSGQIPPIEGVSEKTGEAQAYINQAVAKAITGEISMADFQKLQEEYQAKFGFIEEAYQKYINENKDKMRANGVKMVDW